MKTSSQLLAPWTSLITVALLMAGWAEEPARAQRAFFGVHVRPIPAEVRAQLDLPDGRGLMVGGIETTGPAAKLGIKTYDILTHFNDQILLSADQFIGLVRSSSPGKEIDVTWLHRGKVNTGKLLLASIDDLPPPVPNSVVAPGVSLELNSEKICEEVAKSLADQPDLRDVVLELLRNLPDRHPTDLMDRANCIRHQDEEGLVEVLVENGAHRAKVTNPQGEILFEGPTNTPEEREKIPLELRAKVLKVEKLLGP